MLAFAPGTRSSRAAVMLCASVLTAAAAFSGKKAFGFIPEKERYAVVVLALRIGSFVGGAADVRGNLLAETDGLIFGFLDAATDRDGLVADAERVADHVGV